MTGALASPIITLDTLSEGASSCEDRDFHLFYYHAGVTGKAQMNPSAAASVLLPW